MSAKQTIIEKIKKLLRMKRGGTPDEIATALRLAQDLSEKHGIELDSVNPDDEQPAERPISHTDAILGARIQWECKYASLIADRFFNVTVFTAVRHDLNKYCLRFVGTDWDTQIAIYVYRFLTGHFRREWKRRRGRCRHRQAFMWGMFQGLYAKLRDREPATSHQSGIIQVDRSLQRRKDYIGLRWRLKETSSEPSGDAKAAKYAGWVAGRETEIRSGLQRKQAPTRADRGCVSTINVHMTLENQDSVTALHGQARDFEGTRANSTAAMAACCAGTSAMRWWTARKV